MGDCKGIHRMIDKIKEEINQYAEKPALTPAEWDMIFKAAKAYKDLTTSCAMEEYGEDDYEEEFSGRYRMNNGYSGARRRNSMGRYASGYANEYSGHSRDELLDAYYDMLDEADTEEERTMIKRRIKKLKAER